MSPNLLEAPFMLHFVLNTRTPSWTWSLLGYLKAQNWGLNRVCHESMIMNVNKLCMEFRGTKLLTGQHFR